MSLGRALPVPCLAGEAEFGAVRVAVGCLGSRGCAWGLAKCPEAAHRDGKLVRGLGNTLLAVFWGCMSPGGGRSWAGAVTGRESPLALAL